ncbi:MAG: PLP-dependent aminotransferase family protein [Clostridia bacterium]
MFLTIDRTLAVPLIRQIFEQIRHHILTGEWKAGDKLPGSRQLAQTLGVSRNVVVEAYELLLAEGFIEGKHGAGTFVSAGAFLEQVAEKTPDSLPPFAETVMKTEGEMIDFRSGIPDLSLFPRRTWARLLQNASLTADDESFGYGKPEGRMELRSAVCSYLRRIRGVHCIPDQVVITSGTTQAITLAARLLLTSADHAVIEDPITRDIYTMIAATGCRLHPIPVDELGLCTEQLPQDVEPRLIFTTPSHQFPLGGTLSIQRRIQLIRYARQTDAYVVEDDYDSEFRHFGAPVSSLQGLAPERVIYIGTFSKILSPALRIGYLILPPALVERCRELKWFTDLHSPPHPQLALAQFLEDGSLQRHIVRMKKRYLKRRDTLIEALEAAFGKNVGIMGASTGMHLVAAFAKMTFDSRLLQRAARAGVSLYPVEWHAIRKGKHLNKLIFGYGHLEEAMIQEGISRLKHVLEEERSFYS